MKHLLDVEDLVGALQTFGDRYEAVDVFADDLSDSARAYVEKHATLIRDKHGFRFSVFPNQGVVRLERVPADKQGGAMLAGAALGGAIAAASRQRGEGILGGALLGLLVGGLLSTSAQSATAVRKVFAMELDPATRTWVAYDGTLLRWMKDRLLPPKTEESRW